MSFIIEIDKLLEQIQELKTKVTLLTIDFMECDKARLSLLKENLELKAKLKELQAQ